MDRIGEPLARMMPQLLGSKASKPLLAPPMPHSGGQRTGGQKAHKKLLQTMQVMARPAVQKTIDGVTDKTNQGNLLIGATALCALVALLGIGLSAAGIPYLHMGSLTIPVDVSKLAAIAFYSGAGAMIGLQLRKQGKLKAKEEQIQHSLERTREMIGKVEQAHYKIGEEMRRLEGEIHQLLKASQRSPIKHPSLQEVKAAVEQITSLTHLKPRSETSPLPKEIETRLHENSVLQNRLAQIYQRNQEEGKGERLLKKVAILAGIGLLAIFGLQLYAHFGGHLRFDGFGLKFTPTLLAASTVLMYGLSLLDLGLSTADSVPIQMKNAQLEQEQREYERKAVTASLEESHLKMLQQQAKVLRHKLTEAQIEIEASELVVKEQQHEMESIRIFHLKHDNDDEVGLIARELGKPSLGANLTKGVLLGATAIALAALAGLIYSTTGTHNISILGNVTALTPKTMGMVAFYGIAIAIVAQQVLARMKTQKQIDTQKEDFNELERQTLLAEESEQEIRALENRKWDAPHGLIKTLNEPIIGQYADTIKELNNLRTVVALRAKQKEVAAPAGRLLQRGLGVATALGGLAVLAYLLYSLIDRNGAAHLLKQAHSTNLVQAAILASNGFAILYAGASLWQNARIREEEATRRRKEQDLEARLLNVQVTEHQNALVKEQRIYLAQSQVDEVLKATPQKSYQLHSEGKLHE